MRRLVFTLVLCAVSLVIHAGSPPVAGLRDYSGAYLGSGRGWISYSVLFRDNYDGGTLSGCNGEGCGKHPGVDIAVSSGTPVYAALSGRVVRSECNMGGWGGLIIVESESPYRLNERVFQVYAHLRKRLAGVGEKTYEGDQIGESGGAANDYCPGNSTGSHLHFQINRDNGGALPWYPTGRVNESDAIDLEVTRHTYNPIPFVSGGYRWTFDRGAEYWSPVNAHSFGVAGGAIRMISGNDPWIWRYPWVPCEYGWSRPCSGAVAVEAEIFRSIVVELDLACVSGPVQIFFITDRDPVWDEKKSVSFRYTFPASYWVDMSTNPYWRGIVTGLRIDPTRGCNPPRPDPDLIYSIVVAP